MKKVLFISICFDVLFFLFLIVGASLLLSQTSSTNGIFNVTQMFHSYRELILNIVPSLKGNEVPSGFSFIGLSVLCGFLGLHFMKKCKQN